MVINTWEDNLTDHDRKRFDEAFYMVEANSFEQLCLWEKHHQELSWKDDSHGFTTRIAEIDGHPICVSVRFATLLGQKVVFWTSESMVTHWEACQDWVYKRLGSPRWDNGYRVARCDAMNFGHCISACYKAVEKESAHTSE